MPKPAPKMAMAATGAGAGAGTLIRQPMPAADKSSPGTSRLA